MHGIIVALMLLIGGVLFVAPYAAAVAFYTFPVTLLIWALRVPRTPAPALANVTDEQGEVLRKEYIRQRDEAAQEIASQLRRGHSQNVRFIERESRFENRSNLGQELNRRINSAKANFANLDDQVEALADPGVRRYLAWRVVYLAWRDNFRFRSAIGWSIGSYLLAVAILEYTQISWPVVWAPSFIRPAFIYAGLAAWLFGALGLALGRDTYRRLGQQELDQFIVSADDAPGAEGPESSTSSSSKWQDVLRVAENASVEEIKAAYKDAIKRCHPDFVSNMSDKIRKAAAAEAVEINRAYIEARQARGF
jgi:hypothetical protein